MPDMDMEAVAMPPQPDRPQFADAKSLRSHIFQKKDIQEEIMDIPEWDCQVMIKGVTGAQRAHVMRVCMEDNGQSVNIEKMYALTIIASVRHPDSKEMVFSQADQRALMSEKSGGVIERLAMASMRVSGLDMG